MRNHAKKNIRNVERLKKNVSYFRHPYIVSRDAQKEILAGLKVLNKVKSKMVTVFGSHILDEKTADYKHCYKLAYSLGKEGYGIVSGGGPGIMHAANKGAFDAGAPSVGLKASLVKNEPVNEDVYTHQISFKFMFVRRFALSIKSEALVFYPGGYGTLNELFEYLVLIQTKMLDKVPLICVNKKYWEGLFKWLDLNISKKGLMPNANDIHLLYLVDDVSEIRRIIEGRK